VVFELYACLMAKNGPPQRVTRCVFSLHCRSRIIDTTQQIRRRHIRRTDILRGEIESDRLRRLLDLTKGLDALRLVGNHERLLIMTWLRNQMSTSENQLVPKSPYFTHPPSSMDHSPGRYPADAEPTLVHGESPCFDEAEFDDLHHENSLLVNTSMVVPQESDAVYVAFLVVSSGNVDLPS
jgi:hypothetical protein